MMSFLRSLTVRRHENSAIVGTALIPTICVAKINVLTVVAIGIVSLPGCLVPGPLNALTKKMLPKSYEVINTSPPKLNTRRIPTSTESNDAESASEIDHTTLFVERPVQASSSHSDLEADDAQNMRSAGRENDTAEPNQSQLSESGR